VHTIPNQLLKNFANIPSDFTGDLFGQIYEYFLAEFARSEGSKGGEFFTPRSVVRLMVEMIEPHGGKVFDPACGSGRHVRCNRSTLSRSDDENLGGCLGGVKLKPYLLLDRGNTAPGGTVAVSVEGGILAPMPPNCESSGVHLRVKSNLPFSPV
jgi:hypothetical protein